MLIDDQLNMTGRSCLVGPNDDALGPRFVAMNGAYDADLRALRTRPPGGSGSRSSHGVYAGVLGPSYETPAEIRMLRALGATPWDEHGARGPGVATLRARCLGLACITNPAAGLSPKPPDHAEVQAGRRPPCAIRSRRCSRRCSCNRAEPEREPRARRVAGARARGLRGECPDSGLNSAQTGDRARWPPLDRGERRERDSDSCAPAHAVAAASSRVRARRGRLVCSPNRRRRRGLPQGGRFTRLHVRCYGPGDAVLATRTDLLPSVGAKAFRPQR